MPTLFGVDPVNEICILADSGSNGCRSHAWKYFLQHDLVNEFQLTVTVVHYPTGTSKWNSIEHRLFSEGSKNWAGVPLETVEVILNYLPRRRLGSPLQPRSWIPHTSAGSKSASTRWISSTLNATIPCTSGTMRSNRYRRISKSRPIE